MFKKNTIFENIPCIKLNSPKTHPRKKSYLEVNWWDFFFFLHMNDLWLFINLKTYS